MRVAISLGSAALFAAAIHGQVIGSGGGGIFYPGMAGAAVTGAPYSADEINEHEQTLVDGTHIHQKLSVAHHYRDSQGRTRVERQFTGNPRIENAPVMVEINDPVAGYRYNLDAQSKTAHRVSIRNFATPPVPRAPSTSARPAVGAVLSLQVSPVPVQTTQVVPQILPVPVNAGPQVAIAASRVGVAGVSGPVPLPAGAQQAGMPEIKNERLDPQTIEGVLAEGHRTTMTFPIDSEGNDRPIVRTSETWMSPDLKIMMLSKSSDPRSGESNVRITNLRRGEPDSTLFQVPADYTIVDESSRLQR